jgi:hypothetical protein
MEAIDLPGGLWLEPAVGDGAIVRAVERQDVSWTTCDIREDTPADFKEDFLTWNWVGTRFNVAITNSPFSLAQPFAEKMLKIADIVILLVRLNWIGGPRASFLRANPPDIYVLPNRPSFVHGGTDSIEYAFLVWGLSRGGHWQLLADTPLAERKQRG